MARKSGSAATPPLMPTVSPGCTSMQYPVKTSAHFSIRGSAIVLPFIDSHGLHSPPTILSRLDLRSMRSTMTALDHTDQTLEIESERDNPNIILRLIWFVLVGWWLGFWAIVAAYLCLVLIIP